MRYAEVCFFEFGDRVKQWITFNEPLSFCSSGYATGSNAPGHQSNSATEPYSACHHLLLAHGAAVRLYRQKYQTTQRGTIGITLNPTWCLPYSSSKSDVDAQQRTLDFSFGWYVRTYVRTVVLSLLIYIYILVDASQNLINSWCMHA